MNRLTIRNSDGSVSQPTSSTFEKVFNRLAEYEDTGLMPKEIKEYAEEVAVQFGYRVMHNGRAHISAGGLSALEYTFDILGWDEPHPYPEGECQFEGCHEHATSGTPTKNGYMRTCSKHYRVINAREEAERALEDA